MAFEAIPLPALRTRKSIVRLSAVSVEVSRSIEETFADCTSSLTVDFVGQANGESGQRRSAPRRFSIASLLPTDEVYSMLTAVCSGLSIVPLVAYRTPEALLWCACLALLFLALASSSVMGK